MFLSLEKEEAETRFIRRLTSPKGHNLHISLFLEEKIMYLVAFIF